MILGTINRKCSGYESIEKDSQCPPIGRVAITTFVRRKNLQVVKEDNEKKKTKEKKKKLEVSSIVYNCII